MLRLRLGSVTPPTETQSSQVLCNKSPDYAEHPELGQTFKYPGPFAQFSRTPIAYRRRPPTVGEHNREIYLGELGFTAQQLTELQKTGVI